MPHNYLLTGLPRCGKSTLLERVMAEIPHKKGFLTKEVLRSGQRTAFVVIAGEQPLCTLAHVDYIKPFKVSKYYVDVDGFESVLQPFFTYTPQQVLYLDEIGQMELFSPMFKELVRNYLDAPNLFLGTLSAVYHNDFTKALRKRSDVTILEVTPGNREDLFHQLYEIVQRGVPR